MFRFLHLQPFSVAASPPDGLPPFNAGAAAHGGRGRRWEGTESRWIDLRLPWVQTQHMTALINKIHTVIMIFADGLDTHLV